MDKISIIGLDIAKNVFQVHGVDDKGQVAVRRQLRRRQVLKFFAKLSPCVIGMEACATAHQCDPCSSCRVRHCRRRWAQWCRQAADTDCRGQRRAYYA